MRTIEKQAKNIKAARAYAGYEVTQAIRTSGYGEADIEIMVRIINARYEKDAMRLYEESDTAVREYLQNIIEETYYGEKPEKMERNAYKASQFARDVLIHAIKDGNISTAQDILARMEELGMTITISEPKEN